MSALIPKRVTWQRLSAQERQRLLQRPALSERPDVHEQVAAIVDTVRRGGDKALRELTSKYDHVDLKALEIPSAAIEAARKEVALDTLEALDRARQQIGTFHGAQRPKDLDIEVAPGVRCMRQARPIERVGLYVPGGTAPLCSTVLMLAVPAKLAGCPIRILCTPPDATGAVDANILAACALCGVQRVFCVGGAQAIAAMAFGTESVPSVDKVFGPGNAWVTAAKELCAQDPQGAALDLPAGPSEVMVIADANANPAFVAADLLSQAEHGADSQVVLVATSPAVIDGACRELERQLATLPRRHIAEQALARSFVVMATDLEDAVSVANQYAPEHLILQVDDARALVPEISAAGSVFIGPWSPESVGDYASGTNHVLPTYGYARAFGGVALESFLRQVTFQELSAKGLKDLGPVVETLAELEGLTAHGSAVRLRLNAMQEDS